MSIKQSSKYFLPVLIVMLASLVALSPFAIDSFLAAMPLMADFFGVKISMVELAITFYFFGFAAGSFLGGPLSDSFGRKTVALTGIALYGISAFLIPFCSRIEYVLLLRVIQAFGGGFATVTSNVFVRDWYEGKQVARFITIISMIMMLAPLFAPVIGAGITHWYGWKSVFFFMFAFSFLLFIAFLFIIPESRNRELITKKLTKDQLLSKYKIFFSNRQSTIILFAISFSMSGFYLFLTSASFIYMEYFGVSQNQFPLFFGANVILNIAFSFLNTFLLKKYKPEQIVKAGLLIELIAGLAIAVAVQFPEPSLWSVSACIMLYIGSLGIIFGNGTAVILNQNPRVSGSANATIGIARFVLSFLIGSIMALFHTGDLIPIGIVMFICSLVGNLLYAVAMKKPQPSIDTAKVEKVYVNVN